MVGSQKTNLWPTSKRQTISNKQPLCSTCILLIISSVPAHPFNWLRCNFVMTEMFLICDRQTRGGRRGRRSCCCSGYANTCDKTLQQIVMLNFWSQSGRYSQKTFRRRRKPLFSLTPKQNCRFLNFYLFIYLFIFQLRFTWRGK